MKRIAFVALLLASTGAHAAGQEPWDPIARQCAERIIAERCPKFGNCSATWPLWAWCTLEQILGPEAARSTRARYDWCVKKIWDARWKAHTCSACGDPTDETIHCVMGR